MVKERCDEVLRVKDNLSKVNVVALDLPSRTTYLCESNVCALTIACFGQHSRNYIVGAKSMVGLYLTALSE